MKLIIVLLRVSITTGIGAQPPNNAIFFGSLGDGAGNAGSLLPTVPIYRGSSGDGIATGTNNQSSNSIFTGGVGDGHSVASDNSISNNIFTGSSGDGFSHGGNGSVSNIVFLGGAGDGSSHTGNNAVANNIFKGGEGDGWHAVIFPMGPLPVKLLSFSAERNGKSHLVKWITTEEINTSHFDIQRSADGAHYTSLGITPSAGAASTYSFDVETPWQGNNFYRLKMVDADGSFSYSNVVLLKESGSWQLTVFPNPTASVLYIKLPELTGIVQVAAQVFDAQGRVLFQADFKPGSTASVKVDTWPAGLYTLKFMVGTTPIVIRFAKNQ